MKELHLICNAHLDPVWQWTKEEGIAAVIGTYKIATDLAEEFDYIFCHNESMVYEMIKKYDITTYNKIKNFIKAGKWKITGGWYIQPDCNMPSGESLVRQILVGNKFFKEEFNCKPTVATNYDSFGHSIGLVQILTKTGYNGYLITRPSSTESDVKDDNFIWQGVDDSEIVVHRDSFGYSTSMGHTIDKIKTCLEGQKDEDIGIMLWGTGNHGGGPSRIDLSDIKKYAEENKDKIKIIHSYPEGYFGKINKDKLKVRNKSIGECFQGTYTTQIDYKKTYREMENLYFQTERICSVTSLMGLREYPHEELKKLEKNMLFLQFHDTLPGTCIRLAHDRNIEDVHKVISHLRGILFDNYFVLANSFEKSVEGSYPIIVYNSNVHKIKSVFEKEFMLKEIDWDDSHDVEISVYRNGKLIPSQTVKEESDIHVHWRQRVAIEDEIDATTVVRYDCYVKEVSRKEKNKPIESFEFKNGYYSAKIENGLLNVNKDGKQIFCNMGNLSLYQDCADSWAIYNIDGKYQERIASFKLASVKETTDFYGSPFDVAPMRIIEDGDLFVRVECLMVYNNSKCVVTYTFYKNFDYIDVKMNLLFLENSMMLKYEIPLTVKEDSVLAQTCYAEEKFSIDGLEHPMQKYVRAEQNAVAVINNGIYGFSCKDNTVKLSLARGSTYCALTLGDRDVIQYDRFHLRTDQGFSEYKFRILTSVNSVQDVDIASQEFNEEIIGWSVFAHGNYEITQNIVEINGNILLGSMRKEDDKYILRLFNQGNCENQCTIRIKDGSKSLKFKKFEIKTLEYDGKDIKEYEEIK